MPFVNTKPDDIAIINPDIVPRVHPLHKNSKGEPFSAILKNVSAGDIVIGDFNVDLFDEDQIQDLESDLEEKDLMIEISVAAVNELKLMFKIRSESAMYSQQILKNNVPSVFLKDIGFKLVTKKTEQPLIPEYLKSKLKQLNSAAKSLKSDMKKLISSGHLNAELVNERCQNYGVINYHHHADSHFHDHTPSWYHDEESQTLIYAINSINQSVYDYSNHYKDWDPAQEAQIRPLYTHLERKVLIEFHALLSRDKSNSQTLITENMSNQELRTVINSKLKSEFQSKNEDHQYYIDFLTAVLNSNELKAINSLLKKPFNLDDEENIAALLAKLTSPSYLNKYSQKVERLVNLPFQGLEVNPPARGEQAISLNGTGFDPFKDEKGNFVSEDAMRSNQINFIVADLKRLKALFPNSKIAVAVIEGVGQQEKIDALTKAVAELNEVPLVANLGFFKRSNEDLGTNPSLSTELTSKTI